MTLQEFKQALSTCGSRSVNFEFAEGGSIEAHFHVTEIGKVTKDFVDCGGTRRTTAACVFQTYVANDVEHRLNVETLDKILQAAKPLALDDSLPVEVEYQQAIGNGTIGLYAVAGFQATADCVTFLLASKATACLAPDRCGLDILSLGSADDAPCCGDSGCC